jgi:hypothetical protein
MVDSDPVQQLARRLMLCARAVALARARFERIAAEQVPAPVEAQREAMRRWQVAEDRERETRSRLAGQLDVTASDLIVTANAVLYSCARDADRPRHRRGTMPLGYTIYRREASAVPADPGDHR